tara:strand:- start:1102 stop:1545 length:444 start_codon:yes stop_codon:yes gene_type:complete
MKRVGERVLTGVVTNGETVHILSNEAQGFGWLIREIRVMPNRPAAYGLDPATFHLVRCSTRDSAPTDSIDYEANTTVGVASFIGGTQSAVFDHVMITTDLFVTGMAQSTSTDNEETIFRIELEQFEISPVEEIQAILKETAQAGVNQ